VCERVDPGYHDLPDQSIYPDIERGYSLGYIFWARTCAFPEHAAQVIPALKAQIEAEPVAEVKADLVESLDLYMLETGSRR
jgi:hypothetical protein